MPQTLHGFALCLAVEAVEVFVMLGLPAAADSSTRLFLCVFSANSCLQGLDAVTQSGDLKDPESLRAQLQQLNLDAL